MEMDSVERDGVVVEAGEGKALNGEAGKLAALCRPRQGIQTNAITKQVICARRVPWRPGNR